MSSEKKLQWIEASKVLWVIVFAFLYQYGGIEMKWIRRFIAPIVLCLGMFTYTRDWKSLLQAPLMMLTLCMGYGGTDQLWGKIVRRGTFGLCNGLSSCTNVATFAVETRLWLVPMVFTLFQIMVVTGAYVALGVFNPMGSARAEEFALGFIIAFLPMMFTRINKKQ